MSLFIFVVVLAGMPPRSISAMKKQAGNAMNVNVAMVMHAYAMVMNSGDKTPYLRTVHTMMNQMKRHRQRQWQHNFNDTESVA